MKTSVKAKQEAKLEDIVTVDEETSESFGNKLIKKNDQENRFKIGKKIRYKVCKKLAL